MLALQGLSQLQTLVAVAVAGCSTLVGQAHRLRLVAVVITRLRVRLALPGGVGVRLPLERRALVLSWAVVVRVVSHLLLAVALEVGIHYRQVVAAVAVAPSQLLLQELLLQVATVAVLGMLAVATAAAVAQYRAE